MRPHLPNVIEGDDIRGHPRVRSISQHFVTLAFRRSARAADLEPAGSPDYADSATLCSRDTMTRRARLSSRAPSTCFENCRRRIADAGRFDQPPLHEMLWILPSHLCAWANASRVHVRRMGAAAASKSNRKRRKQCQISLSDQCREGSPSLPHRRLFPSSRCLHRRVPCRRHPCIRRQGTSKRKTSQASSRSAPWHAAAARRLNRAAVGPVLAGIGGLRATQFWPVRRSASSKPEMRQHIRAHSRRLACAGTTPTRPASRASGITARTSQCGACGNEANGPTLLDCILPESALGPRLPSRMRQWLVPQIASD